MKFSPSACALAAVLALGALPAAHAEIFTITGTTAGKPTFTRPFADLSGLSPNGIDVLYDAFSFGVSASGSYTFLTTGAFDTFTILYRDGFIPTSSLTNAVAASDDLLAGFTTSGFAATLTAGVSYIYVTTGFAPTDVGAYSTTIGGPGTVISAIPEPASFAMLAVGLGLVGAMRGRRAAANG